MDLASAGLKEQPFRTHGKPLSSISYAAYDAGLAALEKACSAQSGISLFQGPALSGKTNLIREFVASLPDERAVAIVDGANIKTINLLESLLRQFGYVVEFNSASELLAMLRVFTLQQAASQKPPVIIVENAHALNPSTLRALAELAGQMVRQTSAIRLFLVSDRPLRTILEGDESLQSLRRIILDYHLRPMSLADATRYVHAKLHAAGSASPANIFPADVCAELWHASGGWPGILDRVALLALAKAPQLPVSIDNIERPALPTGTWAGPAHEDDDIAGEPTAAPVLFISHNGELLKKISFDKPRILVGRSEHNDLSIESRFISRHHMLLIRNGNATFLMDLNSTNGSFVNSKRASNQVLIHDDVIAIGHHRIKFSDPTAKRRRPLDGAEFADTSVMKTLEDMRAMLARENTDVFPEPTENVPTLGS